MQKNNIIYLLSFLWFIFMIPYFSYAQSFQNFNRIDSEIAHRQFLRHQDQEKQFNHNIHIQTQPNKNQLESFILSESKKCYDIKKINLIEYNQEQSQRKSQFNWALNQVIQELKIIFPYCISDENLVVLMKNIQNSIIDSGYTTTRVLIQEQDLNSGELNLIIIPGKINQTIIIDEGIVPHFTSLSAFTGLTFKSGDLLNVRDIEQSLENFKRIPTVEANIEIIPSESGNLGESDLKITHFQKSPIRFNLNLDDSGSKLTGKLQTTGTLLIDSPFTANDLFYISYTRSFKKIQMI